MNIHSVLQISFIQLAESKGSESLIKARSKSAEGLRALWRGLQAKSQKNGSFIVHTAIIWLKIRKKAFRNSNKFNICFECIVVQSQLKKSIGKHIQKENALLGVYSWI